MHINIRICAYQGVRNVRFLENLAYFVFLKYPFWNSPFCLIANNCTQGFKVSMKCKPVILIKQNRHAKFKGKNLP